MPSVTDLPPEILHLVLDHLPLSSHFSFASACKTFTLVFHSVLQRHQDAHRKYRVASDRDPSTVLLLLRSAFEGDPIPAWHVRSFEIWRDRSEWGDWVCYTLDEAPPGGGKGVVDDVEILGFQGTLSRVGRYIDQLGDYLRGSAKREKREKALGQVEYGHDGVLKALLVAALPRLADLKFVTRSQATGSTLSWLKVLIAASKGAGADDDDESVRSCEEERPVEHVSVQSLREARRSWSCDEEQREKFAYFSAPSPTEEDFNRMWDREIAKWNEKQRLLKREIARRYEMETLLELGNMELCEPEMDLPDASDASMEACEPEMDLPDASDALMEVCEDDCVPDSAVDVEAVSQPESSSDSIVDPTLWPPGFVALRSVAVGVVSETWMDDPEYPKSSALVARLLRLPRINTLYFNGLQHEYSDDASENDDDSDAGSDWEGNDWKIYDFTSSVQHLFFEGMSGTLNEDTRKWLCSVPRELLTIAFRDSGPDAGGIEDADCIVFNLVEAQSSSLQSLMWYGFDESALNYSTSSILDFSEDNLLSYFDALRHVSCNVEDFATGAYDCDDGEDGSCTNVDFIATAFPESIEHLVLWGDTWDADPCPHGNVLELGIIKMIQSKQYKHLKAIHLEQVQRATKDGDMMFEEVVAVGRAAGVEVFTRTNRLREMGAGFPRAVDWYDLRTGKCPDGVPDEWLFNSYCGEYEPPC